MAYREPLTLDEFINLPDRTKIVFRWKSSDKAEPRECFLRWDVNGQACCAIFNFATMNNDLVIMRLTRHKFFKYDFWVKED